MTIKNFAEAVADFAVRNGLPTLTEADFMSAMDGYIASVTASTNKLMTAGKSSPVLKPFFHISAARVALS